MLSKKYMVIAVASLALFSIFSSSFAIGETSSYTPPKLLKSYKPVYPTKAMSDVAGEQNTDHGLVEVLFMVDEFGVPQNAVVSRSTNPRFNSAAIKSIARHKYQPAQFEGKNVAGSAVRTLEFRYQAGDRRSVRGSYSNFTDVRRGSLPDGFRSFHEQFTEYMNSTAPEKERAKYLLERMFTIKHQSLYSLSYYYLALYKYAARFDQTKLQLINALEYLLWVDQRVTRNHRIVDNYNRTGIVAELLKALIESGDFTKAVKYYDQHSSQDKEIELTFDEYMHRINELKAGDSIVQRSIELSESGYALEDLLKPNFVVEVVEGEIEHLSLRCQKRYLRIPYKLDLQIQIPNHWGDCNLQISGRAGTSVVLLQQ